jgi:hypothetical protein
MNWRSFIVKWAADSKDGEQCIHGELTVYTTSAKKAKTQAKSEIRPMLKKGVKIRITVYGQHK